MELGGSPGPARRPRAEGQGAGGDSVLQVMGTQGGCSRTPCPAVPLESSRQGHRRLAQPQTSSCQAEHHPREVAVRAY